MVSDNSKQHSPETVTLALECYVRPLGPSRKQSKETDLSGFHS